MDLAEGRERAQSEQPAEPRRSYSNDPDSWFNICNLITLHPACCIAAVNGYAIAGGMSIVNSCDLAIASERAEFGTTEMGFGSFPALVAPLTAKTVLPKALAQLVFTLERVNAETALRIGLVNKVVPHDKLMDEVNVWADRIAQLDANAIDWAKKACRQMPEMNWDLAAHYGQLVSAQFRAAGVTGGDSRDRFLAGQPGLGQGTQGTAR
jgi:enoyl-CoA hydratase/carnithine racemase